MSDEKKQPKEPTPCPKIELGIHQNSYRPSKGEKSEKR